MSKNYYSEINWAAAYMVPLLALQAVMLLAAAARSVSALADLLERHPEALIQGKGNEN